MSPTPIQQLHGRKIWIAGAARSGIAAAKLLQESGLDLFVSDSGILADEARAQLAAAHIPFEEGGHSIERFQKECDLLVLSPAIPLDRGLALLAQRKRIPVVSEIEVASWFVGKEAKIIGITGTNGKSTVTNYLTALLLRNGRRAVACGNFGFPFAEAVRNSETEFFVIELSSYQLETTYTLRPTVSILLNLQNDHQARYQTMEEYLKAKWRLLLMTDPAGLALVDQECVQRATAIGLSLPEAESILLYVDSAEYDLLADPLRDCLNRGKSLPIPLYSERKQLGLQHLHSYTQLSTAAYDKGPNHAFSWRVSSPLLNITGLIHEACIPGEHNIRNLLAATAAALFLDVSPSNVKEQWEKSTSHYTQIPHRMEVVGSEQALFRDSKDRVKQLLLVNDSKATNVESAVVALRSYQRPIRLLLGGDPKGESYAPIAEFTAKNLLKIYPFGKAAAGIVAELAPKAEKFLAAEAPSLFQAALNALDDAVDGDIILLSPACASFDQFKNFEHRGDAFREWALTRLVDKR